MYEDRPYQSRAIEEARAKMLKGTKRFIFQASTGSGKTIIAGILVKSMLARNKRVLFAAHRRELVTQPYKKFTEDLGIAPASIGVVKADLKNLRNPGAPIQIVSIQSVYRKALPRADVVIIDECHLARSASYEWLLEQYPDAYIIGLTATPTRLDGRSLGDIFEDIVVVAQPSELFEGGWIVAPRMFTVPESQLPDLAGIHHLGGDFKEDELAERAMKVVVMGSIVDHWALRAKGLRTILFAVTKKHSMAVTDLLVAAGIRARHVDGETPKDQRDAALLDLKEGRLDILCQVGLWIEGLDMPELKCAIMARPTESIVIHLQTAGRIMRPWEGMVPILLDHAGNCRRLGPPTRDRVFNLREEKQKGNPRKPEEAKVCKVCFSIVEMGTLVCPSCGAVLSAPREVTQIDGVDLVEITDESIKAAAKEASKQSAWDRLWRRAYNEGFDRGWVLRRFAEKFGEGPPLDWKTPDRPVIEYTFDEKDATVKQWMKVRHKNNLPFAWLEQKYLLKFNEPYSAFVTLETSRNSSMVKGVAAAQAATADDQPTESEKVPLEY
jgi:DNA repair protein RadD